MANEKFCVECKHHEIWWVKDTVTHRCNVFNVNRFDLVTGEKISFDRSNDCYVLREMNGKCGIDAKFFKPKE